MSITIGGHRIIKFVYTVLALMVSWTLSAQNPAVKVWNRVDDTLEVSSGSVIVKIDDKTCMTCVRDMWKAYSLDSINKVKYYFTFNNRLDKITIRNLKNQLAINNSSALFLFNNLDDSYETNLSDGVPIILYINNNGSERIRYGKYDALKNFILEKGY